MNSEIRYDRDFEESFYNFYFVNDQTVAISAWALPRTEVHYKCHVTRQDALIIKKNTEFSL